MAHEYGHHVQDILGLLDRAQQDPQGAESGAVRIELMADCLAGVWANHATDDQGRPAAMRFLKPLTAAGHPVRAVRRLGRRRRPDPAEGAGPGQPETWTHGSSAQRQNWFTTGYQSGDLNACDTLNVPTV